MSYWNWPIQFEGTRDSDRRISKGCPKGDPNLLPLTNRSKTSVSMLARISVAAVLCFCVPQATRAQSTETESAATEASSPPFPPTRIIDVEAARRAKRREHTYKLHHLPLKPFESLGSAMEKGLVAVDKHHLIDRAHYYLTEHDRGFLPLFGNFGTGTGMTLGVKYYRNDFLVPGGHIEFPVRVSSLLYQEYGAAMRLPVGSRRGVFFDAGAFYRVRTRDNFFGLGNDSSPGGRTTFMLRSREFSMGPGFDLPHNLRVVTRFGYRSETVLDGKDPRFPGITAGFVPGTVPGILGGVRQWIGGTELVHDTRDFAGRPRHGSYQSLAVSWHQSADERNFAWWRYELNAEHYVPLGSRNRTLALRFQSVSNLPRGGSAVPFFDQAFLGGLSTLRGFPEYRFRDLSSIMMTAEYRYNLNSYMDVVTFVDAGEVMRRTSDFNWSRLHASYGIGLRFLSRGSTPFKIIVARSGEGTRVYLSIGATF